MTENNAAQPAMQELKPCPFCGGPVELEKTIGGRSWWGVVCRNTRNRGGTCAVQIVPSASKEAAIERWNMRAPVADERAACPTDVCQAGKADGVLCANDECDRANGVRVPFHDQPQQTGVGEWCAPGPATEQRQVWLLRFADADRGDCVYYDEQEARRSFAQAEGRGWNCYLFEYARRAALASAPVGGEAMERIEQMAVARYRAVPCGQFSHKVIAGDGSRSLHVGPKDECLEVAAHLTEAFLDGAFVASSAAPQASAAVRILFPTHLRKMWSGGEVQAWLDQLQGTPPAKPSAKGSLERYRKWQAERDAAFGAGIKAAADLVKKMVDDYDSDHGSTDPETGTREYPGEGAAWVCEMEELEESIRALSAQPGAQRTGGSDA